MHAFIFTGDNKEKNQLEAERLIQKHLGSDFRRSPDFLLIEKDAERKFISLEQIAEEGLHFLSLKPSLSNTKILYIRDAEFLTEEAQNAMLKNLEEPTASSIIVMTAFDPGKLLVTIRSRVELISVPSHQRDIFAKKTLPIASSFYDFSKNFDTINGKEEHLEFIDNLIINNHNQFSPEQMVALLKSKSIIANTNVNPRLTLESWYIRYCLK